jgi:hypothetical protein
MPNRKEHVWKHECRQLVTSQKARMTELKESDGLRGANMHDQLVQTLGTVVVTVCSRMLQTRVQVCSAHLYQACEGIEVLESRV